MANPSHDNPQDTTSGKSVVGTHPMTARELRLHEDMQWGSQSPEVQQHVGKAVVIKDKRVVAVDEDPKIALAQAIAREHCPWWDFVVEIVPPQELWDIPPDTDFPTEP